MSFLGHIAIGVATARAVTADPSPPGVLEGRMLSLAGLSMLPDIDLLANQVAPTVGLFDHRGPSHSLFVAVLVGVAITAGLRAGGRPRSAWWGLLAAGVVATHPLMDVFGDSNLGVALLWPFSDARFLAPWQFLPNPMLGGRPGDMLGELGLEALVFLPVWIYAFLPREIRNAWRRH